MNYSTRKIAEGNTRPIFLLLFIICAASIIDVLGVRILNFVGPDYSVTGAVFGFIILFSVFLMSWILVTKMIAPFTPLYTSRSSTKSAGRLYRVLKVAPFVSASIIIAIILEMIINSSYHIILIPVATLGSYIPAIIILSILIFKLGKWFKSKRDYIMLAYTIALTTILLNAVTVVINFPAEMTDYNLQRKAGTIQFIITYVGAGYLAHQPFVTAYQYSSFISFVATWAATALLLSHYSRKTGKVIYWSLVALPLLYFLGQYSPIFNFIFSDIRDSDPSLYARLYILFFGLTKTVGGLFFGVGFWTMAKSINNKVIRTYLGLSGCGILLIFIATQSNSVLIGPYPPFGIIALSSMALASNLTFVGIYFTALSIAKETNLRVQITQKVKQLAMLGKMGTAQMEQDLLRQVKPIVEKHLEKVDEIPTSLEDEDIQLFVKQALREIKKRE